MKKVKLKIEGMHCAACAGNVERALLKVEGVNSATVSVMTNKAIIETDDSVDEDSLKKAVSHVGYKVS